MNQENYADQPPYFKNQPEYLIFPRICRHLHRKNRDFDYKQLGRGLDTKKQELRVTSRIVGCLAGARQQLMIV